MHNENPINQQTTIGTLRVISQPGDVQRRRPLKFALAAAIICGLLALVLATSEKTPVQITVKGSQPAEMLDDAGAEMVLTTLVFRSLPHAKGNIYFGTNWLVELKVGDRWSKARDPLSLDSLGPDETRKELILVPGGADRCRIRFQYAGVSIWWKLGGFVSRLGIKLPPSYWKWAGWPKQEGPHPHWKSATIEILLPPQSEH